MFEIQPYKLELIKDLPGQDVSIYQNGEFVDLCKGPHVKNTKEINPDAFRLTKIAGAYWKGSEKNKMLTRIYGLAFETEKELAEDEFWSEGTFMESVSPEEMKLKERTIHMKNTEEMNYNCKQCSAKISAHNKEWHVGMCDKCFDKILQ